MKKIKFMRNILSFFLLFVLIFTIYGCVDNAGNNSISTKYDTVIDEKDLDYIYEAGNVSKSYMNLKLKRTNVIPEREKREAPSNILDKINVNGVEHKLTYVESEYSLYENTIFDEYFMGDDPNTKIQINNGQIRAMFPYAKVNISSTATPEEALEILKNELNKIVDISKYANVSMPLRNSSDRFRRYSFIFYNSVEGYITDTLSASINDEGKVDIVCIQTLDINVSNLNINKKLENEAIELKLKDVYGDAYHSYELTDTLIASQRKVVFYNNELYICYILTARFIYDGEIVNNFLENFLIPVAMISNK